MVIVVSEILVSGNTVSGNTVSGNTVSGNMVSGNTVLGNTVSGNTVSGITVSGNAVLQNTHWPSRLLSDLRCKIPALWKFPRFYILGEQTRVVEAVGAKFTIKLRSKI